MLYPVELQAHVESITPAGRGRGIRTPDIQLSKLALYQTELYPVADPWNAFAYRSPRMLRATLHLVNPYPAHRRFLSGPIRAFGADGQVTSKHDLRYKWRARRDSNSRPPSS